ncbi:MAG: hypothetical protein D3908_13595, partial [Candidatus Electrothrix sp. AUS4]|nr:hypothetical protein [Candidatus Electrothrix sp. AUS4]
EDDAVTLITGTTAITGTVFEDDGAGSNNGNGTYDTADTGEVGIAGVPVSIYFDADGSGTYSEGDYLWEELTTDANGEYTSSSTLPAGDWFVVVGDLPVSHDGWASTTGTVHTVTTTTGTETAPDTGFAPALTLDKQLVGSGPINEGDAVSYTIDLNNELYGAGGTGDANSCTRDVYATADFSPATKNWYNTANAVLPNEPEGTYTEAPLNAAADMLIVGTFPVGTVAEWGNVTGVELVIPMNKTETFSANGQDENIDIVVVDEGGVSQVTYNYLAHNIPLADTTGTGDVITTGLWTDLVAALGTNPTLANLADYKVQLISKKSGAGADTGNLFVDAVALRITTDQPCHADSTIIDPLPLYDTFDANKIEFVSASPTPDRLVPYDDGDPTTNMYRIEWDNLGPLNPSETTQVTVNFTAL